MTESQYSDCLDAAAYTNCILRQKWSDERDVFFHLRNEQLISVSIKELNQALRETLTDFGFDPDAKMAAFFAELLSNMIPCSRKRIETQIRRINLLYQRGYF